MVSFWITTMITPTERQVEPQHYSFCHYVTAERWNSYWHQIDEALDDNSPKILIIGVGDNIVPTILKSKGMEVKTFDFDPDLNPDYVGDIRDIASLIDKKSFDIVMCCQVLEHLEFENLESTLLSLMDIAKNKLVVSIPYNHRKLFYFSIKLPKFRQLTFEISIPSFWVEWEFDGEHFWEVGTKGYQKKRIDQIIANIAPSVKSYFAVAYKYHLYYIISFKGDR